MRTRIFAMAAIAVMLLNIAALAQPDTRRKRVVKRQSSRLVPMLPASDAVAVFDAKRFLNDALPKILSSNQPVLAEIVARVNEMENRTGIDLRKFEQVAVGVSIKVKSPTDVDFDTVAIANGDINAGALIAIAKLASKGTYREEKIGERTVYVFNIKDAVQNTTVQPNNSKIAKVMGSAMRGLEKDIAVTTTDGKTLVMGSLDRVRETLAGTAHVGNDLTSLLSVKETAVMSFAVKAPENAAQLIPLDNDELGANINSIQYVSGALDVASVGTSLQLMARTKKPEDAASLKDTLAGLQMVGKAFLGGSKRADQQVYARMLKNVRIQNAGNDVTVDLLVPQADIDVLVAAVK